MGDAFVEFSRKETHPRQIHRTQEARACEERVLRNVTFAELHGFHGLS